MTLAAVIDRSVLRRLALVSLVLLAACRIPADPEGTTDAVSGQTLRVGALEEPMQPADSAAVARIADAFDARLELVREDPHTLVTMLEKGEINLLAGRLPDDTPFKSEIALSDPFARLPGDDEPHWVVGLRQGENRFLTRVNQALKGLQP